MPALTATDLAFLALVAIAAWSDVRARRVANELVLVIFAGGLLVQGVSFAGLAGAAVGLGLLLPAFAARWVGGGDVKLLAACGAWLGPWDALIGGLLGIALGGALAIAMAIAGGVVRDVAHNLGAAVVTLSAPVGPRRHRGLVVPLAVPLAAGCTIVWFGGLA